MRSTQYSSQEGLHHPLRLLMSLLASVTVIVVSVRFQVLL